MPQDKENAIQKDILLKTAENSELLGDIKNVGIETVNQLEKVQKSIKEIKIPDAPIIPEVNFKETNTLLKELTEEVKKKEEYEISISAEDRLKLKGDKGAPGRDGIDGKDGKSGKDGDKGEPGKDGKNGKDGQNGKDGDAGSPDDPDEIVRKINSLPDNIWSPKIDASHIKNLPSTAPAVFAGRTKGFIESVTDTASVDLSVTTGGALSATVDASGVDHGGLGGLADDDHTQYALLAGRAGGQILVGGTAASEDLTLRATSNATDGDIIFETDPTTERGRILSTGELVWGATTVVAGEFVSIQKSQNAATTIRIKNGTSGTAASAGIGITNSANLSIGFTSYSAGFTTSGMAVADMASLSVNTNLGLNVGSSSLSPVAFWTNNLQRGVILSTGELVWGATAIVGSELISIQKSQNAATQLRIKNGTSGTAAIANIAITDSANQSLSLSSVSAGYTSLNMNVASTGVISCSQTGGMNIGNTTAAQLSFWVNNAKQASFISTGEFLVGGTALIGSEAFGVQKNQNAASYISLTNTTNGTGGIASVIVSNTAAWVGNLQMLTLAAAYTTSGMLVADTALVRSTKAGGLNVGTSGATQLGFWTNNTERARFLSTGEFLVGGTALISSEFVSVQKNQNAITWLSVSNSTSGTGARVIISTTNSATSATAMSMQSLSAAFTTAGILVADTGVLLSSKTGGMNVGTSAATQLSFWTNNTERARFLSTGELIVNATTLISTEIFSIQKNQNAITWGLVSNTTSGTAARATMGAYTTGGVGVNLHAISAGYTSLNINVADTGVMSCNQAAGFNIGTTSNTQLSFWTNNTEKISIPAAGGLVVGKAALATNATDGFLYIPTCAGTPTGTPTTQTGTVPMIFDTTNDILYIYRATWKKATANIVTGAVTWQ